jgi:hypothetical protein
MDQAQPGDCATWQKARAVLKRTQRKSRRREYWQETFRREQGQNV